jgi:hypothetical protein
MPSTVSDTFAFACRDIDAWEVLHADVRTDLGLQDEVQIRAFEAARDHVDLSVEALLAAVWQALYDRAGRSKTTRYRGIGSPDGRSLKKKTWWWRKLVNTRGKELSVGASVEPDGVGHMALYAWVHAAEPNIEALEALLDPPPPAGGRDEDYYYVGGTLLVEGAEFEVLGEARAKELWPVIEAASKLLSTRGGKRPATVVKKWTTAAKKPRV